MDEKVVLAWIQRRIDAWPNDERDMWELSVAWPSELPVQVWIINNLLEELQDPSRAWVEPQVVYEYLQSLAREFGYAMAYENLEINSVPSNLVRWALLVASGDNKPPDERLRHRGARGTLRNLKILSMVTHLREDHGYRYATAFRLIGEVIDRDKETVETAWKNGRKAYQTRFGTMMINALDIWGEKLSTPK